MEEIRFEVDGKEYYLVPITADIVRKAQTFYNKAFRKAMEDGCLLKKRLDSYMREQGLWDDKREQDYNKLVREIADLEFKLNKGGIKISEAKNLALSLRDKRWELRELITERTELDSKTAEGQAENQRFNYLVFSCVYDFLTRKPVFSSFDDYLNNINSEIALQAANKLANHIYGVEEDFENTLVENKFLKRFNFVDDKGRLINKEGKLIDEQGNLINEEGYRIDADGNRIDINNNLIPSTTVENAEFLDDES